MANKFRFTKKLLQELAIPEKRIRYSDSDVAGLICEVSPSGRKVFRVYKRLKTLKSPLNVTIGTFPDLTVDQARSMARETLNRIAIKENPNLDKKVAAKQNVTMNSVFKHYLSEKDLSEYTVRGYKQALTCYLKEYSDEPLIHFDEDTVKKVHKSISERSKAQADLTMRMVRALFNFAKYEYRDEQGKSLFEENPVQILSHLRAWHHVARKQSYLNGEQVGTFLDAIDSVRNEAINMKMLFPISVCDYIETALFTGLRKTELVMLKWGQVDLSQNTFWVSQTKNGEPLRLPISPHLKTIFERRYSFKTDSPYVFNAVNNVGRVVEPKKVLYKISERGGVTFSIHDLRRTYTTVAERIQTSTYTLKRLLNHKSGRNDVTAGYTVLTPEELREPAEKIENKLLMLAGRKVEETQKIEADLSVLDSLSSEQKIKLAHQLLSSLSV